MNPSTPAKQNLRQQQASARRQQILETAIRLFAQQGIAKTTTRQIAVEVGVAEGLIFRYFPTKLDLVRAITASPHIILGDLQKIIKDSETQPLAQVMERVASVWLELLHREAHLSSIMFAEAQINPEIGSLLQQVIQDGAASIEKFLLARQQAGQITTEVDTGAIAHMYMSSIFMFFLRNRQSGETEWKQASALFAANLKTAWLRMVSP